MSESFLNDRVVLHAGDCLHVLAGLPENSVDAVVTDPPYGLGFMGKAWDHGVPSALIWREALRVLKPGGHLVAFAGTRTQHRMATAIEDAGFEIRDLVMWLYGSGFPKSLDVSKAIDKAAGAEREVVGVAADFARDGARRKTDASHVAPGQSAYGEFADRWSQPVTAPATDAARRWQGFGTALKPSNEPVTLARKPLTFKQEWVTVFASLDALEAKLWSMSFASGAELASMPKPAGSSAGVFASAQWNAAQSSNTRDALCARMGTSQFELALASSLSTVSSWKRILADLSTQESTSTIETGLSTTTDLRTLKFSASKITPESIIQGHSRGQWSSALACPAARYLDACAASFSATRERSALASAIEQWRRSSPDEDELKLSPAVEPITLARKPLDGTVAANVLRWGTGAVNIAGCRVTSSTGQRPNGEAAWEEDQSLCGLCAERAGLHEKHITPETREFTATSHAERRSSAKVATSQRATSKQDTGCCAGTTAAVTAINSSIEPFGSELTDPCQSGMKSTTSTATKATTGSRTCSACGGSITLDCIAEPNSLSRPAKPSATASAPIGRGNEQSAKEGRWPANLVLSDDPEVIAAFPETTSGGGPAAGTPRSKVSVYGEPTVSLCEPYGSNTGSAARFFYQAKADSDDRLGSKHPTVKPLDLMRWLVRLVTPPSGLVLDPFAGTGTTGEAAFREGMRAVLIEREAEYQADIRKRMALVMAGPDERKRAIIKAKPEAAFPADSLFAPLEAAE